MKQQNALNYQERSICVTGVQTVLCTARLVQPGLEAQVHVGQCVPASLK